jgi:O-acetyl-ADP-ribose deacetylase (regulator of RNase III)
VLIRLVEGDITTQRADAIVNAANTAMRGGGGVDGAIHRAGGPAILADCRRRFPDGLATGKAGWTTAGDLPARWVIHVVGPNWLAGQRDPDLLASCYREALRVADELGARTVALPAVSTGIYGWPLPDAASIAVETVAACTTRVDDAVFVLFGSASHAAFVTALERVETNS